MSEIIGSKPPIQIGDVKAGMETAIAQVYATMFSEPMALIPHTEVRESAQISALIGFGGKLSGFICVHTTKATACSIAAGLLGMPMDTVDDTVRDAMGEMTNMLAGCFKSYMSKDEEAFKISIPSVIEGSGYSMRAPACSFQVLLGVSTGPCRFKVHLVLEQG